MNELLVDYFSYTTEKQFNKKVLYCEDNINDTREYVYKLLDIPLQEYIDYIFNVNGKNVITTKDIIQFSNFDDATYRICQMFRLKDNPGMKFEDIGKLLLNDGKERNNSAYIKYGENHVKTATSFGLIFEFYNTYYLSGIGSEYLDVDESNRKRLLDRLIIRSTLFSRMIQASQNGNVNMREFLYMISYSTYVRRRSNMRKVLNFLCSSDEYNFDTIIEMIRF